MNKRLYIFIILVAAFFAAGFSCGNSNTAPQSQLVYNTDRPSPTGADDCLYQAGSLHKTPGGVFVNACVDVPPDALAAIERGIAHQIRNSSHYNPAWPAFRKLNEYQVFLVPPTAHNVETAPGSPALLVKYQDESGNVLSIQSAGTCIGVDGAIFGRNIGLQHDGRYPSIVLPEQSAEQWKYLNYLEESARNESEHIAEWNNDKAMFYSFAITGDVHPHFPDWQ
jgi:hypothetical protein